VAELAIRTISHQRPPTATFFLKRGFYGKPIGMRGPNPNRNPNYGCPWLWRPLAMAGHNRFIATFTQTLTTSIKSNTQRRK